MESPSNSLCASPEEMARPPPGMLLRTRAHQLEGARNIVGISQLALRRIKRKALTQWQINALNYYASVAPAPISMRQHARGASSIDNSGSNGRQQIRTERVNHTQSQARAFSTPNGVPLIDVTFISPSGGAGSFSAERTGSPDEFRMVQLGSPAAPSTVIPKSPVGLFSSSLASFGWDAEHQSPGIAQRGAQAQGEGSIRQANPRIRDEVELSPATTEAQSFESACNGQLEPQGVLSARQLASMYLLRGQHADSNDSSPRTDATGNSIASIERVVKRAELRLQLSDQSQENKSMEPPVSRRALFPTVTQTQHSKASAQHSGQPGDDVAAIGGSDGFYPIDSDSALASPRKFVLKQQQHVTDGNLALVRSMTGDVVTVPTTNRNNRHLTESKSDLSYSTGESAPPVPAQRQPVSHLSQPADTRGSSPSTSLSASAAAFVPYKQTSPSPAATSPGSRSDQHQARASDSACASSSRDLEGPVKGATNSVTAAAGASGLGGDAVVPPMLPDAGQTTDGHSTEQAGSSAEITGPRAETARATEGASGMESESESDAYMDDGSDNVHDQHRDRSDAARARSRGAPQSIQLTALGTNGSDAGDEQLALRPDEPASTAEPELQPEVTNSPSHADFKSASTKDPGKNRTIDGSQIAPPDLVAFATGFDGEAGSKFEDSGSESSSVIAEALERGNGADEAASSAGPIASTGAATAIADPRLESFIKMIKVGVPDAIVRSKMEALGIDPSLVLESHTRSLTSTAATATTAAGGAPMQTPSPAVQRRLRVAVVGADAANSPLVNLSETDKAAVERYQNSLKQPGNEREVAEQMQAEAGAHLMGFVFTREQLVRLGLQSASRSSKKRATKGHSRSQSAVARRSLRRVVHALGVNRHLEAHIGRRASDVSEGLRGAAFRAAYAAPELGKHWHADRGCLSEDDADSPMQKRDRKRLHWDPVTMPTSTRHGRARRSGGDADGSGANAGGGTGPMLFRSDSNAGEAFGSPLFASPSGFPPGVGRTPSDLLSDGDSSDGCAVPFWEMDDTAEQVHQLLDKGAQEMVRMAKTSFSKPKKIKGAKRKKKSRSGGPGASEAEAGTGEGSRPKPLSVLDGRRVQNASIALKRYRSIGFDRLADCLYSLELDSLGLPTRTENYSAATALFALAPKADEVPALVAVGETDAARLSSPEAYLRRMALVKRFDNKLSCWEASMEAQAAADEASRCFRVIRRALKELIHSRTFHDLLLLALAFGNYLNKGLPKGKARGFSLASLERLASFKGYDNKTTAADILVAGLRKQLLAGGSTGADTVEQKIREASPMPADREIVEQQESATAAAGRATPRPSPLSPLHMQLPPPPPPKKVHRGAGPDACTGAGAGTDASIGSTDRLEGHSRKGSRVHEQEQVAGMVPRPKTPPGSPVSARAALASMAPTAITGHLISGGKDEKPSGTTGGGTSSSSGSHGDPDSAVVHPRLQKELVALPEAASISMADCLKRLQQLKKWHALILEEHAAVGRDAQIAKEQREGVRSSDADGSRDSASALADSGLEGACVTETGSDGLGMVKAPPAGGSRSGSGGGMGSLLAQIQQGGKKKKSKAETVTAPANSGGGGGGGMGSMLAQIQQGGKKKKKSKTTKAETVTAPASGGGGGMGSMLAQIQQGGKKKKKKKATKVETVVPSMSGPRSGPGESLTAVHQVVAPASAEELRDRQLQAALAQAGARVLALVDRVRASRNKCLVAANEFRVHFALPVDALLREGVDAPASSSSAIAPEDLETARLLLGVQHFCGAIGKAEAHMLAHQALAGSGTHG